MSGSPLLEPGSVGASGASSNPLLAPTGGKGAKKNPLLGSFFGSESSASASESLPVLEQEAAAVGAPTPAQDSPGLFRRAIDVLMRGNYAAAGAAEETFAPQGGGLGAVPGRVANELFSGVGSLKGQKEGFAQVMEQAGVGAGGSFSDLIPGLYNETGEGARFQKGGWADPTGRGAVGLGLDVALDPMTYIGSGIAGKTAKVGGKFLSRSGQRLYVEETAKVTAELARDSSLVAEEAFTKGLRSIDAGFVRDLAQQQAKERVAAAIEGGATNLLDRGGIKWAGIHIADNPLSAIANSGVAKELAARLGPTRGGQMALASTAWVKKNLVDTVGTLIVKGWGVKGLEGARQVMDDALNLDAYLKDLAGKEIEKSPLGAWAKKSTEERDRIFKPVIDAFESGGMAAVPDEFKPAIEYLARKKSEMFGEEVVTGLLTKEQKLQNYFAHYYRNDPDELARVIYKVKGGLGGIKGEVERLLRMGRNAEERSYTTLKDAIEGSTSLNAADKSIPILRPVYDPIESLRRRWEHSITKRVNRKMVEDLQAKFVDIPIDELYDLARPAKYGADSVWQKRMVETVLSAESRGVRAEGETATRDVFTPGKVTPGINKVAAVEAMSPTLKRAFFLERFRRIGDRAEAHAVLNKYQGFEEFFPKKLVQGDIHFAADGSPFKELNVGGGKTAVLPESLANEVAAMADHVVTSKAGRTLLQGFDTANNLWKGSVTWLFPSFHVRNAYSNVAQSFVDIGLHSINPRSYAETASILFGKGEGVFKTATGSYTYDEVRHILNRHGVNTSARALAEFTGNESKLLKPFAKVREAGTAIENESRAQLALNYLRRGMDPEEVGARVKKFQLDYSNGLTSFERQWMKRMIPFYSFHRLNLGLQLENIVKRPGMTLTQVKPFVGRADENAQMTSWDAGALKLRLNRDGKNVQMITGIDLPIRNLDLLFRGTLRETMANGVGMLTPFLKVPIEVGANKSFFTGNEFDRKNAHTAGVIVEQMPKSVQQWMGYKKEFDKAGRPQYTFDAQRYYLLAESYVASRFLSTSDRQWRQYLSQADGNSFQSLLDITTGFRYQNMNMDEEMAKRASERKRDLERALVRWGERKQFERVYRPKP